MNVTEYSFSSAQSAIARYFTAAVSRTRPQLFSRNPDPFSGSYSPDGENGSTDPPPGWGSQADAGSCCATWHAYDLSGFSFTPATSPICCRRRHERMNAPVPGRGPARCFVW